MPETENQNMPPLSTQPTEQHGQIMYALGQVVGELKGVQARQDVTNGHVLQNTNDISDLQKSRSENVGKQSGQEYVWKLLYTILGLALGLLGAYAAFHH